MRIAREGWAVVGVAASATVIAAAAALAGAGEALWWTAGVLATATLALTWFFRDPRRTSDALPGGILAPADGRVIVVRRTENAGWVGEPALQISIFLSLFDVHVNRYPVGGTVEYVDYSPGRFEPAWRETASSRNERLEVGIRTDEGVRVLVRQVAGLVARRIVNPSRVGQRVQRGDRMGMIRFGSRTDLFLPAAARASVRGGDRAVGGVTVLAELP